LYGAGYGIFVSVLPASLALSKDFDNLSIGVFFALFYVAISVAQLIVGPLSDRHGRHLYMIAGLVMAAMGFALFEPFPHPWVYVPLTLASFGLGVFCVSSMAYLNECVPESLKATISGGYYLSWGLGYFLGPLVVGKLGEMADPRAGYYLLALLFAVQAGVLCLCRAAKSRRA
jgi:MFS family permease